MTGDGRRGDGRDGGVRVRYPVMYQSWNLSTFLHWRYDPEVVQALLPPGHHIDTFDGSAWLAITPFLLENLRAPGVPALPWISRSPETNVRTYVHGPDGRPGIWFFSLDFARLPAVLVARTAFRLPYMWSRLHLERRGSRIRYEGRRLWPDGTARYRIEIEPGAPVRRLAPLDRFLLERRVLFITYGSVPASLSAEHAPWPLWRARVTALDETLVEGAGLPTPEDEPIAHFSLGVDTRISAPLPIAGEEERDAGAAPA